jgi:hypothetical protein
MVFVWFPPSSDLSFNPTSELMVKGWFRLAITLSASWLLGCVALLMYEFSQVPKDGKLFGSSSRFLFFTPDRITWHTWVSFDSHRFFMIAILPAVSVFTALLVGPYIAKWVVQGFKK